MIVLHEIALDKALEISNKLGKLATIEETADPYEMVKQDKDVVCNLTIDNKSWFIVACSPHLETMRITLNTADGEILVVLKSNQYKTVEIL